MKLYKIKPNSILKERIHNKLCTLEKIREFNAPGGDKYYMFHGEIIETKQPICLPLELLEEIPESSKP